MSTIENSFVVGAFLVLALAGVIICYVEIIQRRMRYLTSSVFSALFTILLLIIPIVIHLTIGGAQSIVTNTAIVHSNINYYLVYLICAAAVLVGQILSLRNSVKPAQAENNYRSCSPFFAVSYLVILASALAVFVYSTGMTFPDLVRSSRFAWSGTEAHSLSVGLVADYLYATSPLCLLYCARAKNHRIAFVTVGIVILLCYGACTKDRKWLIFIISAFLAVQYFRQQKKIQITAKLTVLLVAAGIPLVVWQVVRDTAFVTIMGEETDFIEESKEMIQKTIRSGDAPYYYNASIEAIAQNLDNNIVVPFSLIRRQVLFFLPSRFSFGIKPEDMSASFSDVVFGESDTRRGNMPPGFVGNFVLSFYWFGAPIALAFWPLLLRWCDRLILERIGYMPDVFAATSFSSILLILRGDDSGGVYYSLFNVIIAFLLHWSYRNLFQSRYPRRVTEAVSSA